LEMKAKQWHEKAHKQLVIEYEALRLKRPELGNTAEEGSNSEELITQPSEQHEQSVTEITGQVPSPDADVATPRILPEFGEDDETPQLALVEKKALPDRPFSKRVRTGGAVDDGGSLLLKHEIKVLESKCANFQKDAEGAQEDVEHLRMTLKQAESQFEAFEEKTASLEESLRDHLKQHTELEEGNAIHIEENKQLAAKVQDFEKTAALKASQCEAELSDNDKELEALEAEHENILLQKREAHAKQKLIEKECGKYSAKEKKFLAAASAHEEFLKEHAALKDAHAALEQERNAIQQEADEHREKSAKLGGELAIKSLMVDEKADEVQKHQEQHAEALEHREKLQKEKKDLHGGHDAKTKEIAKTQNELNQLKGAIKVVVDDIAVKRTTLEQEAADREANANELSNEIERLQEQIEGADTEISTMKAELDAKTRNIEEAKLEKKNLAGQLAALSAKNRKLKAKLKTDDSDNTSD